MEYKLIIADNPEKLSEKVSKNLEEGWKLYGNPIGIYTDNADEVYGQAITRGKK
jgi:hypothetical protein